MNNIMLIFAFVCGFVVYRIGVRDGGKMASGGKIGGLMHKKTKKTDEEQRISKGMENILNYANRRRGENNE
ncbi:MAG: hypothetical protein UH854_00970 [Clostridia bacterium]|nr:hypothetical protein [Clostridia bacterium]